MPIGTICQSRIARRGIPALLGAEDAVAAVAQTGDDVGMLVQLLVAGSNLQIHIVMCFGVPLDALGAADDVHHDDVLAAVLLQEVDSRNGRAAG